MMRNFYKDEHYVNLEDCKKCPHFVEMEDTFVTCNFHKSLNVCVPSMPANWQKGFTNDMIIVRCVKKRHEL